MTTTVHTIKVEPLTDDAFKSFGQIISAKDRAPDYVYESGTRAWGVDFESGTPHIMVLQTPYRGLTFSKLERHFNLTQTFFPMGGSPAVLAVAPPGSGDRAELPSPSDVRAFLLDGSVGYVLGRGVWHSLDRYPLYAPATQWAILTDRETQTDIEAGYAARRPATLTQEIDFAERGVTFSLAL